VLFWGGCVFVRLVDVRRDDRAPRAAGHGGDVNGFTLWVFWEAVMERGSGRGRLIVGGEIDARSLQVRCCSSPWIFYRHNRYVVESIVCANSFLRTVPVRGTSVSFSHFVAYIQFA
jgi:hypothetical protein